MVRFPEPRRWVKPAFLGLAAPCLLLSCAGPEPSQISAAPTAQSPSPLVPAALDLSAIQSSAALKACAGQQVIVTGQWHNDGSEGPFITGPDLRRTQTIYVLPPFNSNPASQAAPHLPDGTRVQVQGVLQFYELTDAAAVMTPDSNAPESVPNDFYFTLTKASIRVPPK